MGLGEDWVLLGQGLDKLLLEEVSKVLKIKERME